MGRWKTTLTRNTFDIGTNPNGFSFVGNSQEDFLASVLNMGTDILDLEPNDKNEANIQNVVRKNRFLADIEEAAL